jgi:RimJ/RimL family protein N-acetyltransferase
MVKTEHLELRAVSMADLPALYAINSDPQTWSHDPSGRHTTADRTRVWIERAAARWRTDGLSYWSVRLYGGETAIGIGGVQRHATGAWNLYYRFAPAAWGHGYASEMSRAAIEAGGSVDPEVPVIAWISAHNLPARRVAERLGFKNYGEHLDANDGQYRLAYANRSPYRHIHPPVVPHGDAQSVGEWRAGSRSR